MVIEVCKTSNTLFSAHISKFQETAGKLRINMLVAGAFILKLISSYYKESALSSYLCPSMSKLFKT